MRHASPIDPKLIALEVLDDLDPYELSRRVLADPTLDLIEEIDHIAMEAHKRAHELIEQGADLDCANIAQAAHAAFMLPESHEFRSLCGLVYELGVYDAPLVLGETLRHSMEAGVLHEMRQIAARLAGLIVDAVERAVGDARVEG